MLLNILLVAFPWISQVSFRSSNIWISVRL